MKKYLLAFIVVMMLISTNLLADEWTETFNDQSSNSYPTGTIVISGRTWTTLAAGNFTFGNTAMGSPAFTINDDIAGAHITSPALNTIGTVSFKHASNSPRTGEVFVLQKSYDNVSFTTIDTQDLGPSRVYQNYSFDVNDSASQVYLRIVNDNQAAHIFIDDFSVTNAGGEPSPLSADFSADHVTGFAPLTVTFTPAVTGGTEPYGYAWDFDNDGSVDSTAPNPSHTYSTPGTYSVKLTVTDGAEGSVTETKIDYITVSEEGDYQELMTNGDFEEWTDVNTPTGWNSIQNITQETTIVHNGNNSAKQTAGTKILNQDVTGIIPGESYIISYWYLDNDANARSRMWSYWLSGAATNAANEAELRPSSYSTDNAEWQQITHTLTAPAGVDGFRFEVRSYNENTGGGVIYYDDFSVLAPAGAEIVSAPVISPEAGQYEEQVEITITCATEGATIYYTTNGDDPTISSTEYSGAFTLTESATVKAFAVKTDYNDSIISEVAYIVTETVVGAVEPTIGTLFISEVSDAVAYQNEYIEFYNNSDQLITLENITLRMDLTTSFGLNNISYVGDRTILPYSYIIISRGNDRVAFETEFGALPAGVTFLQGSTSMFFGTTAARRWQLVLITDAKAETIIDDTIEAVGGSGNTSYQSSPGNWVTVDMGSNTPGAGHGDQTLPVTLSSFMAIQTAENFAHLTWVTHSESGIIGYDVLRSEEEDEALAIRVNSQIIEANNEATSSTYNFTDDETEMNTTYYYWLRSSEFDGTSAMFGPISIKIGQENDTPEIVIPTKTVLRNIYPNPFNPSTTVNFYMDKADNIKINVFNVKGQLINRITEGNFGEGFHNVVWNGKDLNGNDCSSGIYFFRMETKTESQVVKGILLK